MCIYWLQGNCNKTNCIFRHMEITKQRDRIACWFESQPGGCRKPHCPFQHQNILDHPREEDFKKKPDLILPVKKEDTPEPEKPVVLTLETEVLPTPTVEQGSAPSRQPQYSTPIIVPLHDGESDSESVSASPQKRRDSQPRLSAQMEWELRRLRQIQEHEANLIGYTFEEEQESKQQTISRGDDDSTSRLGEFVVEEVVVEEEDDENDAAHRRLYPPSGDLRSRLSSRSVQKPPDEDLRHSLLKHRVVSKGTESRPKSKMPICKRLGGVASRALAETLGNRSLGRKGQVKRLTNNRESTENVNAKSIARRLSGRLGRESQKLKPSSERVRTPAPAEKSPASRAGARKSQQPETKEDVKSPSKSSPDTNIKKRLSKSNSEKIDTAELDFTVKSLADIRAEKRKKSPSKRIQMSVAKNGTKQHACESKDDEGEVRVLTLAEIRASKQHTPPTTACRVREKRALSPRSFTQKSPKKSRASESGGGSSPVGPDRDDRSPSAESPERRATFGTRKIAINRLPVKVAESEGAERDAPRVKSGQSATPTVQDAGSSSDTPQAHSSTVQDTTPGKREGNGTAPSNRQSCATNCEPDPSCNTHTLNRVESLIDEEEALLLEGDVLELEDDDVDEDQLLL
ncbi:zinc finger CCCH domain-containing protein 11A-like [Homarus americanus]|uniref:zinc finger CCCH domain-containing protein 11A-like n=1 Tax=Homarus americanus TaxID=6706 RepID=UPI001C480BC0|nr:zinc finger CCCH domain-containing protein 11A-like [Homarus americanus]XP_042221408.1 zinc finger CCCH domain-containing protein 11A-like [Homarus americanus]XP_042221409.1 zinc finger CCCH domain-containing protein 11A-like [Homarus americanus]XP_042221410.1 zinc finger CCCH domain-containing protein 11A-like [Homarus americanus]XP_042221411.1 zinc finger CCCH domain-containing protein 11A-like [Homarus americanus]XP_042221412.1 zinc finger CCCH domain-containing protein 11A-like [Homarus